ncbi:ankyrin repeat and fibronectin type-III domain-containing protein 1 isoform X1 [Eurosta solidaginis]|uniref:ankyrin repeat and fibronectin type-III domain-containing protein 1 isoform X1 n=1 Tax=Eurosta solidaginis TaxID=178769 RepID=UPI003530D223
MNRCCNNNNKSMKSHLISGCLRSPGALLRQRSFHTLSELTRFCQAFNCDVRTRTTTKIGKMRTSAYIVDDNILPHNLTSLDSDKSGSSSKRADNSYKQETAEEEEEASSCIVGSSYYFVDNKTNVHNDNECGGLAKANVDDDYDIVVLRRAPTTFNKNSSANRNYTNNNSNYYYNNNNNNNFNDVNNKKLATSFHKPLRAQPANAPQNSTAKLFAAVNDSTSGRGGGGGDKNDNDIDSTNTTFRWSEQWTPNVAVAKIRTAISCTANDLREMEFLLPHKDREVTTKTTTTAIPGDIPQNSTTTNMSTTMPLGITNTNNNNNNNITTHNNNNKMLKMSTTTTTDKQRSNAAVISASNGLSVARQAHNSITVAVNNQTKAQAAIKQPTKKSNFNESMELALKPPNLAIYRYSSHVRTKSNGSNEMGIGGGVRICTSIKNANGNVGNMGVCGAGVGGTAGNCGNTPYRNKMSKKQLKLAQAQVDKLNQINLHQHALFSAVEHGHLDKARTILESTDVDVNSINTDGLSALDVAVLSNNRSMTKMLLQHGAIEGTQFSTDTIGNKLNGLLKDAESRIQDLSGTSDGGLCQPSFSTRPSISSIIIGNTGSSVTGCTGNEIEKQIGIWERRVKGLRRLLLGWDQTRPPDAPAAVTVDVTGENSIALQIIEPFDGAIGTKFKVQWSTRADFSNIVGERELVDWMSFHGNMGTQCKIGGLTQGRRYFIRATCGNVKGWGPFKTSVPASVVPSCWRDYNNREDRYVGRQLALDNLFTAVRLARPADVSELTLDVCPAQRRNPKKKTTIKQLFSVASKFQKHLRRGIYLASIIYCEDKVLVTSEDFLPVIEIDETYSSSLHSDYHWLMKVACTWDDVKSLRTDMERNLTSAVHFRTKLLSAVCQLQSTLGLNDLGQLFYKPLRDSHGTVVLTCIQAVKSQKTVSILNSRWLPLNKLQKKIVALLEDYNIHDMLISSIAEQIHYHQASMQRLSPGLYLGYLKMQCSMDQIQVVVPIKTPNVLPHCKVRDNSHITADEWQFLKRRNTSRPGSRSSSPLNMAFEFGTYLEETTEGQRLFLYDLTTATQKLFSYMNIKPQDAETHRLYDIEVIEHSKDISFLIICPAVELTCAVPGQPELLLQRDDLASLSIQSFEMIHLRTYQPGIIQKYARLSCILELDTALATHSHREAFSTSELQTAKERLAKLHELSANLNAVWKSVRWLMDVIAFARDKNTQSSEIMKEILAFGSSSSGNKGVGESSQDTQLLQPPSRDAKYTKNSGRGSWPGPGASHSSGNNCLAAEHSKSEQNLGRSAITPTSCAQSLPMQQSANKSNSSSDSRKTASSTSTQAHLLQVSGMSGYTSSDISLRKNSGDSMTSSQYTTRSYYSGAESALGSNNELEQIFTIPPSRSDDTLALASLKVGKHTHATAMQRRQRTTSNITQHAPTPTSLASSTHCSNSAPYLSTGSSNISLKTSSSSDYDIKAPKASSQAVAEHSIDGKVKAASSANMRDGSLYRKSNLEPPTKDIIKPTTSSEERSSSATSTLTTTAKTASIKSLSRHSSQEDTSSGSSQRSEQAANAPSSGIIQVYTAYNTGLASGTSLKLHVTPKTTAREVINLVVKQLNMAAVLKGNNGPIYTADMLDNFCLVAVIGARERCLRDDFKPLQLQNPWRKGRLYVRQKHELLAAIEHANRKSHLI